MLTKWMNKLINCSFTLFTNIEMQYFLLSNESSKTVSIPYCQKIVFLLRKVNGTIHVYIGFILQVCIFT